MRISNKRKLAIRQEAERRLNLWLQNSSFNEMSIGGSMMRFNMSLGMINYPFVKEKWMDKDDFKRFVTDAEFDSEDYDEIIIELYEKASGHEPPITIDLSDWEVF